MTATVFVNLPLSIARGRVRDGIKLTDHDRNILQRFEGEPAVDWRYETQCLPAGAVVLAFLVRQDDGTVEELAAPGYLEGEEIEEYNHALNEARNFLLED